MWTARGLRAALFFVAAAVMSVGILVGSGSSAGAVSCQPGTTQLIAAMSGQIPATSPLWTQIQAALGQGEPGGNSTDAVISVLNRNKYTYDCATNQVRDTSGTARSSAAGAASSTGAAAADPGTTAPFAQASGSPGTGNNAAGSSGATQGGTEPPTTSGSTGAVGNLASNQGSTGGSGGGGDTLPIVIALVLSTVLLVFVVMRHFRKGATNPKG